MLFARITRQFHQTEGLRQQLVRATGATSGKPRLLIPNTYSVVVPRE